jgi:uncharacterized membrane protein
VNQIHTTATIDIDLGADALWRIVSDCSQDVEWRQGVLSMEQFPAGPLHEGSTFVEVLKMMGQRLTTRATVLRAESGVSFHWRADEGADVDGRRTVRRLTGSRSRVNLQLTFRPSTPMERLMRPVFAYTLRRTLAGDVGRLKRYAEARVSTGLDGELATAPSR